jgi:putative membrane-bound dehydrogenase-like protein
MKRLCAAAALLSIAVTSVAAAGDYQPPRGNHDFPIYTNKPPGKQITANQVAATTPALSPEETRKLIQVPPGFEVRLFAAEPMVVNPVAMTWDERGRLWVVELYEYPKGAPKGEKGRDRIKILEDTDADGVADKVTVFADGYSLATGIALGHGGVYLGQAPHLYFLEDTNGDDKMDKQTILKTGFGMEDRHELLNGFAWGQDGWLYMTHGVFTHSKVRDPQTGDAGHDPDGFGVQMDAALARFHPVTKKFEVFADGTSNPWGVDWNERGDAFVSACVIQHLFHMAPGGQYNRQGGTWANPYGYVGDLPSKGLPAIVDFRHYRAAHAGLCVYQGDQYPAEWRGLVMLGNIHQSALNCDRLTPVGATYKAEKESKLLGPAGEAIRKKSGEKIEKGEDWKHVGPGNFLVSRDPWFRPVATHTGPDGAMWVMDWYDKYPCYQNAQADPEGVDRVYGRIWRVVWVGDQPGKPVSSRPSREMDLTKESNAELLKLLEHANSWQQRQGRRLIAERLRNKFDNQLFAGLFDLVSPPTTRQPASVEARLAALGAWSASGLLQSTNKLLGSLAGVATHDRDPVLRASAVRFLGERRNPPGSQEELTLWTTARSSNVLVRAATAVALRQYASDSLTVNELAAKRNIPTATSAFEDLLARPSVPGDTYYPHIVWMAMEPRVATDPKPFFPLLAANDNSVSAYCTHRVMRRICDLSDATARAQHLNAALQWLADNAAKTQLASAALDGLIEAMKSKGASPTIDLAPVFAKLTANPALAEKARRLATLLGDTSASKTLIAKINDSRASLDERLKGIQAARETKDEASRTEVVKLMTTEKTERLLLEGTRSLSSFSGDEIAYALTDAWKNYSLPVRRAVADVLVTRSKWARALLAGVENKAVAPQDISATARRALADASDKTIADNAERLLGRYRPPGADKLKLIADKRAVVLSGTADASNGHEVAKRTCFVCHKLYGEGADVGPDLTGVGRSTLEALLHNVIDPNEVVGGGFETTEVTLKDDSTVSGRVVEETDTRIKLVAAGPMEHTLAKSDIKLVNGKPAIRKTELSLMPDGLEQIPDKDFRDMIMFILNPPGDKRPWTPALRKELIGSEETKSAQR